MVIVRLHPSHREAAAHAALTHRLLGVQTREATTAAALSLCPQLPSSPSLMKAVRRVPVQLTTCLPIPEIKTMETTLLCQNMQPHQNLTTVTCSKGNLQRAVKGSKSLRNARQSNFMRFQPFTVLTKTRWILFLKVALLSASWVSSNHFFLHQILPSRALVTAWPSPLAWPPLCSSPSLWPPCLQTQSKTGYLEEPVQSCRLLPSMHHQNPSRKLKDRAQLELWVLGIKNPAGHMTVMVSCPPGWLWSALAFQWCETARLLEELVVPWVLCPAREGHWCASPSWPWSTSWNLKGLFFTFGGTKSHFHLFSN